LRGSAILPSVAAIFVCAILTLSDVFPTPFRCLGGAGPSKAAVLRFR
jgi:hypothetical protein